jgi:hypothetical protein
MVNMFALLDALNDDGTIASHGTLPRLATPKDAGTAFPPLRSSLNVAARMPVSP